jgi:hypothetical protein
MTIKQHTLVPGTKAMGAKAMDYCAFLAGDFTSFH